jgi:hypothetical protein
MPVILAFRRLRHEDGEFKAKTVRPCLENNNKRLEV